MKLFGYGIVPFLSEDPFPLVNGRKGWGDIEVVDHDTRVNPRHIFMVPSKDVQVIPQEKD